MIYVTLWLRHTHEIMSSLFFAAPFEKDTGFAHLCTPSHILSQQLFVVKNSLPHLFIAQIQLSSAVTLQHADNKHKAGKKWAKNRF